MSSTPKDEKSAEDQAPVDRVNDGKADALPASKNLNAPARLTDADRAEDRATAPPAAPQAKAAQDRPARPPPDKAEAAPASDALPETDRRRSVTGFPEPDERTRISGNIADEHGAERTRISGVGTGSAQGRPGSRAGEDALTHGLPPPMPTVVADIAPALPSMPSRLVEAGTLINNNYRIEALVSAGGMGEVYRAINVFTGDPVAVKVILPELARDNDIIDLFRREARVLVQLRDDAIVSYHNFILDQGLDRYCLIMEFVEGTHLGSRIRERLVMADDEAVRLLRRLSSGLRRAHARGVTHRDLSPDNVILRHDRVDEAVLIDFGIARSTELGDGLAGRFAGKFKYIAPEQLGHYDGVVGPPTDAYGLALLMAAVIRGQPLDMGDSVVSASAARQAIPDLSGLSHRIFPLLQHMLEPDPADRPADMGQVIAMLDDPMRIPARYRLPLWQAETTTPPAAMDAAGISESPFGTHHPAPLPQMPAAPPPEPRRRGRAPVAIAVGAAALIAAAGAAFLLLRGPSAPPPVDPETVAATDIPSLPPRDPASRDGVLAELPLGSCAMAQRITSGPQSGMIALYAAEPVAASRVLDPFEQAFATRPTLTEQRVTASQCPVVDFVNMLSGRSAAPPLLGSAARATESGFQIEATVARLSGRNLWLALIAPDGAVYDMTAQSSAAADGTVNMGARIDLPPGASADAGSYLLLALASDEPPIALAAAPAGAGAATVLPAVLKELQSGDASAAAALSALDIRSASTPSTPDGDTQNVQPDTPDESAAGSPGN
ncbi:serine/threonine protein kinase [Paracoccus aurantiacus]|uniref:Serine/threonine protein kinase n=1 Tax=Paracoccus aurantiacus TaxID=2599412 RepID=A0A5C6S9U9_9RHOB|nr:serine/threonine-protein kinase [Paracoccus aurantiacus]TXB71188.1 serine/threonine protein kinase [Paracoccus aurantiacus]